MLTDEIDSSGGDDDARLGITAVNLMETPARRVAEIGECESWTWHLKGKVIARHSLAYVHLPGTAWPTFICQAQPGITQPRDDSARGDERQTLAALGPHFHQGVV
jgi:hypothetical protein